jgi:SRSO17 transposase
VQRQYTGTAGRTENAQVAVCLACAAAAGAAFTGRALYLPRSWTSDPARCRAAGVPDGTAFATKPALARQMITRAMATTPSGHSPRLPLPPNSPRPPMITKCRWRIKRQISQ